MEVSRMIFTKETKKAMTKNMPIRKRGEIYFNRLKELEKDGTLSKAKNRADVARLVGYSSEQARAGYSWVSNMVRRGHLTETIRSWSPSGRMEAEYHLSGTVPIYGYEEQKRKRQEQKERNIQKWFNENPQVVWQDETPIKIEITKRNLCIKLELSDSTYIGEFIKQLIKGEFD